MSAVVSEAVQSAEVIQPAEAIADQSSVTEAGPPVASSSSQLEVSSSDDGTRQVDSPVAAPPVSSDQEAGDPVASSCQLAPGSGDSAEGHNEGCYVQAAGPEDAEAEEVPFSDVAADEEVPNPDAAVAEKVPSSEADAAEEVPSSDAAADEEVPSSEADAAEEAQSSNITAPEVISSSEVAAAEEVPSTDPVSTEEVQSSEVAAIDVLSSYAAAAAEEVKSSDDAAAENVPSPGDATAHVVSSSDIAVEEDPSSHAVLAENVEGSEADDAEEVASSDGPAAVEVPNSNPADEESLSEAAPSALPKDLRAQSSEPRPHSAAESPTSEVSSRCDIETSEETSGEVPLCLGVDSAVTRTSLPAITSEEESGLLDDMVHPPAVLHERLPNKELLILKSDSTDSAFEATEDTPEDEPFLADKRRLSEVVEPRDFTNSDDEEEDNEAANGKENDNAVQDHKQSSTTTSVLKSPVNSSSRMELAGNQKVAKLLEDCDSKKATAAAEERLSDLPQHTNGHKEISIQ